MANFEARKVLMKDAQGRYVIPFTGAVETVNGQKPDENGNVVIEGVDTTTLLTKAVAAETYLSKTDAASTYLRVDTAADTFLNKTDAASTYLKAGTAADTFLSKADASSTYLTPAQANAAYLGIGDKAASAETADNAVSATMASKAISDINGNAIATTYATNQKLFQNDGAGPLLRSDIMPIKTVNGKEPDSNGNINVPTYTHPSTHPASMITGLSKVATSGSYNDLLNRPTISSVVVGTVIAFAANGSAPSGYLLCNGGAVSRTTYAALFAAIGTAYGDGDGSTTFNLPDLKGRFLQGTTDNVLYVSAGLPNITGSIVSTWSDATFGGNATVSGAITASHSTGRVMRWQDGYSGYRGFSFDASRCSTIYGNSDTVQPKALALRFYIKY